MRGRSILGPGRWTPGVGHVPRHFTFEWGLHAPPVPGDGALWGAPGAPRDLHRARGIRWSGAELVRMPALLLKMQMVSFFVIITLDHKQIVTVG